MYQGVTIGPKKVMEKSLRGGEGGHPHPSRTNRVNGGYSLCNLRQHPVCVDVMTKIFSKHIPSHLQSFAVVKIAHKTTAARRFVLLPWANFCKLT